MFNTVFSRATALSETDVLALGKRLAALPDLPAKGCEYAWIAAAAVMIAVRNEGTKAVPDEKIREALLRARRQAVPSLCGVGPCGVAAAVTAAFRVLLGTACPNSRAAVNAAVFNRVAEAIAAPGREPDCERNLWAALAEIPALADEYLGIKIPADRARLKNQF